MLFAVFTGGSWHAVQPLNKDLYPSYEICMQNAALINTAPDEKIICGAVVR